MQNNGKTILIIDDDADFTTSVCHLLEAEGYKMYSSSNGKQGLLTAGRIKPDLIILDVMMDYNSEGFDVSRGMRQHDALRNIPIVLITGIHREMNLPFKFEIDHEMLPVNVILEKPVAPAKLVKTIHSLIGTPEQEVIMNKKALVIDDDPEFILSVKGVLEIKGYTVVTAENGAAGFEKAIAENPDCIFMDVMMEGSDTGLEVVKKLRDNKTTGTIPVFLITGLRKPQFLLESYAPGEVFPNVKDVFEKPLPPDDLIAALAKVA